MLFLTGQGINRACEASQILNLIIKRSGILKAMKPLQSEFILFLLKANAYIEMRLETKSGRMSDYYLNFGNINTGTDLTTVAEFYAQTIKDSKLPEFDVLLGPAYKGIPLAVVTAQVTGKAYASIRKEQKRHGDAGMGLGADIEGKRILLIEDVITSGSSIKETMARLKGHNVVGLILGVDRLETGLETDKLASVEISEEFGFPVVSIVTIDDVKRTLNS